MAHTQEQITETISGKLFDLLHHHKWTREITCLAGIDATLKALGETTPKNFEYAQHSHHLAVLLTTKFEYTDDLRDLHEAVAHAENAVSVPDHPHRGVHLSTLVDTLSLRYKWIKNLGDLDQSILYAKMAVSKASQGDFERVRLVSKLINLLELRFEVMDDIPDLDDALYHAIQAEQECRGYQGRGACFSRLSDLSFEKHKWTDSLSDLDLAVSNAERAVDEIAEDHPDRPVYLYKLIGLLFRKYSQLDHTLSLEETILYTKQVAPELWSNTSLSGLLKSEILFEKLKSTDDNDKLKHALLLGIKAPERQSPGYLYYIADILFTKFKLKGDLSFLEQAISKAEKAVAGTPPSHRDRITYLHKLIALLIARFKATKELDDLNATILHVEEIISESQESPDRSVHFFMLGDILMEKFNLTEDPAALEPAIQRVRTAIVESQVGSLHRAACLSELAVILLIRFKSTKDPDDAGKAAKYQEKAIKEVSEGYARDVYVPKPSTTLGVRSELVDDLDGSKSTISSSEAILLGDFRDSRNFTSKLPSILAKKAIPKKEISVLNTAISRAEEEVVTTRGLVNRMASQANLAALLAKRFWTMKDYTDLRRVVFLWINIFIYDWAHNGESSRLQLAISIIKDLVENDLICLPRAAILLGLEPRQDILKILDQAIFHPDDLVETGSGSIKRAVTPFKLLSLAVVLGSRKAPPTFDTTEILSIREHSDIESIKLGRLTSGINSVKSAYRKTHDPQIPLSQIKSTAYNHLEEATPDEDWESLRTKVFDKDTRRWTFEYKAQTVKLCDKDAIFPTAYALPETRAWLGSNKTVRIITGYQTCVSEEVMKQVAAEEIDEEEAAKKGRIFSIRYLRVAL
ncbi:uncharacterized protein H6S33_004649 [Morchella sextelata]|uniref:uncharacterized protein n=1 Tax=Morchella sextelata TaxID=1174677 RepID=UPI001D059C6A|nr:uncharacterized protein H6S33_004649 [Morchella sextelata]KAH0605427.1 hypothetical protein H6S33_004649 [Morchella sextelata]